jgi:hypothetical protein
MGVRLPILTLRAGENRVLRRIFRPRRDEIRESCRKMHNLELHNLYSLPGRIRTIKSRRMRWSGYILHSKNGERGIHTVYWCESQKSKDH